MKWRTALLAAIGGFGVWQYQRQQQQQNQVPLRHKVVVITGASSGIGRATAKVFAAQGAYLVLVARRAHLLAEVQNDLADNFDTRILTLAGDVTVADDVNEIARTVLNEFGRVDVLVNNAGIVTGGTLDEHNFPTWQALLDTNLSGAIRMTQALLPLMKAQRYGHIVNISSIAAFTGVPGNAVYTASKSGLNGFSESLRREVYADGIHVSVVMPAFTATPMTESIRQYRADDDATGDSADSPEYVASNIVAAVRYRKREVVLGGTQSYILNLLYRFAPWVIDLIYTRLADTEEIIEITRQS